MILNCFVLLKKVKKNFFNLKKIKQVVYFLFCVFVMSDVTVCMYVFICVHKI